MTKVHGMASDNLPTVSVMMPAYNCEKYIGEAIECIINQTYTNWELVCVDDGSTHRTLEIMQKYAAKDPRIRVFANPAGALVKGMGHAMAEVWRQLLYLLILGGGCLLAVHWGIVAIAVVVIIGYGSLAMTMAQYTNKLISFGLTDHFRALRVPLLGCAVLLASAAGTLNLSPTGVTDSAVLLVTMATSGLAYCLAVWLLPWSGGRDIMRDLVHLVRRKHRVTYGELAVSTEVRIGE